MQHAHPRGSTEWLNAYTRLGHLQLRTIATLGGVWLVETCINSQHSVRRFSSEHDALQYEFYLLRPLPRTA